MSSLEERISEANKLDTLLKIQNDIRSQRAIRKENTKLVPYKPIDDELLREYNDQFPNSFEYVVNGEKKYRKYMIPTEIPELEAPDLEEIPDEEGKKRSLQKINELLAENNAIIRRRQDNINLRDNLIKKINDGYSEFKPELKKARNDYINLRRDLIKNNNAINQLNHIKLDWEQKLKDNNTKREIAKQNNQLKIENYQKELNILNKGQFSTEQLPNENEEQYLQRLRDNAEIDAPEEDLENAKQLTKNKFKRYMKKLIRSDKILEQVCNSDKMTYGIKLGVLKLWALFEDKFIKTFGIENTSINASDIIQFIIIFIEKQQDKFLKEELGVNLQDIKNNEINNITSSRQIQINEPSSSSSSSLPIVIINDEDTYTATEGDLKKEDTRKLNNLLNYFS